MSFRGIDHDDFYFRLIEAGHTAIFQWIAVYAASIIGLVPVVIDLGQNPNIISLSFLIYTLLILLMTHSFHTVVGIMHKQNCWIEKLSGFNNAEQIETFYKSRSSFSKSFVGEKKNMSTSEKTVIYLHFIVLFTIGFVGVLVLNYFNSLATLEIAVENAQLYASIFP